MGIPTAPERRAPIVFQVEEYGCSPCVAMLPKKVERRGPLIGNTLLGNKIPKRTLFISPVPRRGEISPAELCRHRCYYQSLRLRGHFIIKALHQAGLWNYGG